MQTADHFPTHFPQKLFIWTVSGEGSALKPGELHFRAAENSELEGEGWEVWRNYSLKLSAGVPGCLFFGN
jgi:hypothetical protein